MRHSGYLLGHDLVFTPRQPLGADAFGLGSAAPRAVPLDALVAMAERVADGAIIGRLAVGLPLVGAGLGAAALLRRQPTAARLAAATAAVWNPYVVERLALGQWALLWCYAALPWLVLALIKGRGAAGWAARAVAITAASITPTGGVIALVSTVTIVGAQRRSRRELLASTALALALQLPWLVPAIVSPAGGTSDPAGVAAFSARSEHAGGVLFSLLGGGGIWNADVVPGSRSKALPWLWLAVLAVAALYGAGRLRALLGSRVFIALVALALAGLFIAWLPALPGGAALVRSLVAHVPGAGLIRDAQKWILPLVLLEALLVGAAVDRLTGRVRTAHWAVVLAIAAALTPLLALPDAAASVRPTLTPVHYPRDWQVVAARVRGPGDVAVLPWGSYRRFDWVGVDSLLDPAPRWLPAATVVDDRLAVGGRVLRGESPRSARAGAALTSGPALATRLGDDGIGWIVVEHGTPGTLPDLAGLSSVYRGRDLSLYRVPGRVTAGRIGAGRVVAVVVGDMVALLTLLSCAVVLPIASRTRRKARRVAEPPLL